jgi:hypothetical protein
MRLLADRPNRMDRQGPDAVGQGRGGRAGVQDEAAYEALAHVVA